MLMMLMMTMVMVTMTMMIIMMMVMMVVVMMMMRMMFSSCSAFPCNLTCDHKKSRLKTKASRWEKTSTRYKVIGPPQYQSAGREHRSHQRPLYYLFPNGFSWSLTMFISIACAVFSNAVVDRSASHFHGLRGSLFLGHDLNGACLTKERLNRSYLNRHVLIGMPK